MDTKYSKDSIMGKLIRIMDRIEAAREHRKAKIDFYVKCVSCGKVYKNLIGKTPCCNNGVRVVAQLANQ